MRRSLFVLALGFTALLGCPKSVPDSEVEASADAGVDPLQVRLEAIDAEVAAVLRAQDEALWKHWTTAAPLNLTQATAGHEALFSRTTLLELRAARARLPGLSSRWAAHLERWLTGELLAKALAEENEAVASLEAGLTFSMDGKDVAWRELPRLLLSEKSAVKRRGLWKASLVAAERLDGALRRRDAKAAEVAATFDSPSVLQLAAEARELDLDELAQAAERLLVTTDEAWRAALQRQTDADVRLPLSQLTRAELPRLLRVSPAVDALFPKEQLRPRGMKLLEQLGVAGQPGLTVDLAEGPKKHPLPLTIAPTPQDVRVSFRPVGGLRDQAALFSELGAAMALRSARTGHVGFDRLGDPASALVLSEVFTSLLASPGWLASQELPAGTQVSVVEAWNAHRLFVVRRAAAVVLVRLETQGLGEAESRARFVQVMSRALGLVPSAEDGIRWRVDTDDFLRSATLLKAAGGAEVVRAKLGASGPTAETLSKGWSLGTSQPLEQRFGSLVKTTEQLTTALGGNPDAGVGNTQPPDAGPAVGPWPQPAEVANDGGYTTGKRRSNPL